MRDLAGTLPAAGSRGLAGGAAAALLALYLFALPMRSSVAVRNVLLWAAVLLLVVALARAGRWRHALPSRGFGLAMVAWIAWCVASIAWSVDPAGSAAELRPELATPLAVFLAFHAATDRPARMDLWATALAAGLAVLAALAIVQHASSAPWDPRRYLVDVGYYSTHVVLALPLLAWLATRFPAKPARGALLVVVAATLLVTWWTDNRIAWPTLAAMTLVAAVLAARGATPRQRAAWVAAAGLALVAAMAIFVAAHRERAESLHRMDPHASPDFATDPRWRIWPQALERWTEHPWIGRGFGRPTLALPASQVDGIQDPHVWHAHNVFLDMALELGVVGLAIFVAGLAILAAQLARGAAGPEPRRTAAIAGCCILVGFTLKNFPDDFVVRHIALLCAALAGMLSAAMRWPTR